MSCSINRVDEKCTQNFSSKSLKGRHPLQALDTGGKIRTVFKFMEHEIVFCSNQAQERSYLCCSCEHANKHLRSENAERLSASQGGLCSMELVYRFVA
jgi:hypothetical protein